ncbi:Type IV secretory pathway, VirD4 components (plasmid) [Mesomycoplasma conjunctivae]|nr:Type IV secretory pathway, VirD4 components [Mesomycoplasma conjunctivae]
MLIDQIYQALIDCANSKEDLKLERKFFFMLDEAGNLPPILNLDNKVTISRSRNVFFQLVLQDYNQLKKYNTSTNHNVDSIIRSNLQFTYFLNSIDEKTLSDLSNSLGKKEVIKKSTSKSSSTSANGGSSSESESVEEKPLMSVAEIKAKNKEYAIIQKIGFLPMIVKTKLAYKYFSNDNYVFECDETENTVNESWNYQDLPDVELPVRNPIKNYDQLNDSSRAKKAREESLNKELNDKKVQKKLILEMQNARGSIKELSEYKDKISEWPKLALAWQKILSFQQKYKNKLSSELVNDFTKSINICLDQMNDIKTAGAKT